MNDTYLKIEEKINAGQAKMAVIGLGYVGLPLAVVFASAGFCVTGIDLDPQKVRAVNQGQSYIPDIPSAVTQPLVEKGFLKATIDTACLQEIDLVSICVPTPLRKTGDPDLSYIVSASEMIAPFVHCGMVIALESSTYPGTTREMLLPHLEEVSGLKAGTDFFLSFSPERVDPGRTDWTTQNTPKVVGGITNECTKITALWYSKALENIVPVSSTEVAEMAKLLENTFRMINIGMVNELAIMCDRLGVDVWEVIDAAATKPFGFMKFLPGPGLGGHCIPIDPLYLSWKLRGLNYTARFIDLASEINTSMPRFTVNRITDMLNEREKAVKNSNILILGVAYKPNIDDVRESPALDVIYLLEEKGALVQYHDPYIPHLKTEKKSLSCVLNLNAALSTADCVVILTNHDAYDYAQILEKSACIVDTRNALGKITHNNPKVKKI